jgi:hypothetical protein
VQATQPTGATITNFTGNASIVGLYQPPPAGYVASNYGDFSITGTGTGGNVLGLALVAPSSTPWSDTSGDTNALWNSQEYTAPPTQMTETDSPSSSFLSTTLNLMRANQPKFPGPLAAGQTNVALYQIGVSNARYGLHLVKN